MHVSYLGFAGSAWLDGDDGVRHKEDVLMGDDFAAAPEHHEPGVFIVLRQRLKASEAAGRQQQ